MNIPTNERIRRAAMSCGPKFTSADVYGKLNRSVPMLDIGNRLARSDFVKPTSERDEKTRLRVYELVKEGGER